MGFMLKVDGAEPINLGLENVTKVKFSTDIPQDSNARSTNVGSTLTICGKVITAVGGAAGDDSLKLFQWSLVPAERMDSYRNLKIDVITANQIVRTINFPNAFVVDYKEGFDDAEGVGTFVLVAKQKKDSLTAISVNGGFPS